MSTPRPPCSPRCDGDWHSLECLARREAAKVCSSRCVGTWHSPECPINRRLVRPESR